MARKPVDVMMDLVEWKPCEGEVGGDESLPYATHEGVFSFGGATLRCYQLNDGRRIFDADDVAEFFGIVGYK